MNMYEEEEEREREKKKEKIMQRWFKGEKGENEKKGKESALENTHIGASCTRYVGCEGYSCRKNCTTTVKINKGRDARKQ